MKENPTYYAIIPANVRYDKKLTAQEKLMYGEITVLCNKSGWCWASNKYFAELYEVSEKTISRSVGNLEDCGYITTTLQFDGVKRTRQICLGGMDKNVQGGMDKNVPYNNTSINTTSLIVSENKFSDVVKFKIPKAGRVVIKKDFNLEEEMREMEKIPGSADDHLSSYIWFKDLKLENSGQLLSLKKRFGKLLKDHLQYYSREDVRDAMKKLNKKADHEENIKGEINVVEWTLETVLKELQK